MARTRNGAIGCERRASRPKTHVRRVYIGLGRNPQLRQEAYRELFRHHLDAGLVDQIRRATNGGFVLGTEWFQKAIAATLGRRTWRGSPGRPVKSDSQERQEELNV